MDLKEEEELMEGEEDSGDNECVYAEFTEIVCAIATYMRPDPYVVLDMRLYNFLNQVLYPVAIRNSRFRKILKWKAPKGKNVPKA